MQLLNLLLRKKDFEKTTLLKQEFCIKKEIIRWIDFAVGLFSLYMTTGEILWVFPEEYYLSWNEPCPAKAGLPNILILLKPRYIIRQMYYMPLIFQNPISKRKTLQLSSKENLTQYPLGRQVLKIL